MIRAIIERRTRESERLATMLRELRAAAVHQPGYIAGETLVNTEDSTIVAVISTWRSLEDWKTWEKSPDRAELNNKITPLLEGKPVVRTYQVMAAEET